MYEKCEWMCPRIFWQVADVITLDENIQQGLKVFSKRKFRIHGALHPQQNIR